jgi:ABC-type transport system substrate-binding protein
VAPLQYQEKKMKNKTILFLSILLTLGLLLAACGGGAVPTEAASAPAATSSGSSNNSAAAATPVPASPSGGDFQLDPANAAGDAVGYLYEGLVRMLDGNVSGALAESYTVSEDGLDYIFNLRSGVTFHDGSDFNANAVIKNFNRWYDPKDANRGSGDFSAWASNFGGFKGETTESGVAKSQYDGIEKVDDLTILVHLNTADPDFLTKLTDPAFSIASPNSFAGGDGGSGPYKVSSSSASSLTLEPFADYWDSAAIPTKNIEVPLK